MTIKTIAPDLQEEILILLPNDYDLAMEIMCQLLANMMLYGPIPWNINKTERRIRQRLAEYEGT